VIYFKLSIFQRHHAQERVFDKRKNKKLIKESTTPAELNIKAA
jgi:hypothetical protein